MLDYVGRYTHRVAISNNRLVSIDDGRVRFHWKDYRHNDPSKTMDLDAEEFIRRFLLHVLPAGFQRIRYYGFLGNRYRREKAGPLPAKGRLAKTTHSQVRARSIRAANTTGSRSDSRELKKFSLLEALEQAFTSVRVLSRLFRRLFLASAAVKFVDPRRTPLL